MFNFSDNFFKRVEKRTNVGKDTILNLAAKLQQNDLKNEATLREVIQELGKMTGKEVTKENENFNFIYISHQATSNSIRKLYHAYQHFSTMKKTNILYYEKVSNILYFWYIY